jgi:hypothetical protein
MFGQVVKNCVDIGKKSVRAMDSDWENHGPTGIVAKETTRKIRLQDPFLQREKGIKELCVGLFESIV